LGIGDKHSSWRTVINGVPQGSVLKPPFVLFITDIHVDDGILSNISKFAGDTKLRRAVGGDQEANMLSEDPRRMFRWSQEWQMLFNLEKCLVMRVGKRNQELSYEMRCKVLKVSEEERDFGVTALECKAAKAMC